MDNFVYKLRKDGLSTVDGGFFHKNVHNFIRSCPRQNFQKIKGFLDRCGEKGKGLFLLSSSYSQFVDNFM